MTLPSGFSRLSLTAVLILAAGCGEPVAPEPDSDLIQGPAGVKSAATAYTATILALPTGALYSAAYAINNAGVIVGRGWLPNGNQFAVRWNASGSNFLILTQPAGHISSTANDVNATGTIVGSFVDQSGYHPVFWTTAGVAHLPDFGGSAGATAINDAGLIVGHAVVNGVYHCVKWVSGVIQDLHPAGYQFSRARDVSETGDIVGYAANGVDTIAYVWHADGTSQPMGTFPGNTTSDSHGVNNNGVAVGGSVGTSQTAFYWSNALGIRDPGFGANSIAYGVSDKSRIVGWSLNPTLAFTRLRGVVDTLPNPLLTAARAYDVSLCGTIVGLISGPTIDTQRAAKWTKPTCD